MLGWMVEQIHGGLLLLTVAYQTGQVQLWVPDHATSDDRIIEDHRGLFEHALRRQIAGAAAIGVGKSFPPVRSWLRPYRLLEQLDRILEALSLQRVEATFRQDFSPRG